MKNSEKKRRRKSGYVAVGLAVSTLVWLTSCDSPRHTTVPGNQKRCVDINNVLVDESRCKDEERYSSGHTGAGVHPGSNFFWYYGGGGYTPGYPVSGGQAVPARNYSSPSSSASKPSGPSAVSSHPSPGPVTQSAPRVQSGSVTRGGFGQSVAIHSPSAGS